MSTQPGVLLSDFPLRSEHPVQPQLPLLSTRLAPPRRGRHILPRPRLEELSEQVIERRLTLLCAPPGYGKTALASIWADSLAASGRAVGWVSLDSEDNGSSLQRYLVASISRALNSAEIDSPDERCLVQLLNQLHRSDEALVLFIDNCQRVPAGVLTEMLGRLLQHAPDSMHLVLCSRRAFPSTLIQSLFPDDILQLGVDALRFDLDETRDYARRLNGEPGNDVIELQRLTAGWITGLRACLPGAGAGCSQSSAASLRSVAHLFDGAIAQLPPVQQRALLPLGLLEKFSEALLRSVLGEPAAHGLIDALLEQGLFIQPLDEARAWYGLQPMFREHLAGLYRQQTHGDPGPFLLAVARWFAQEQRWLDAIRTGLDGGHLDEVANWAAGCAMELLEQGDYATLVEVEKRCEVHFTRVPLAVKMARGWALGIALESDAAWQLVAEIAEELELAGMVDHWIGWELRALKAMLTGLADQNHLSGPMAEQCYGQAELRPWVRNVLLNLMSCSHYHAGQWDAFYMVPPTLCGPGRPAALLLHHCYRQSLSALAEAAQGRLGDAIVGVEDFLVQLNERFAQVPERPNPALVALPQAVLAHVHYLLGDWVRAQACLREGVNFIEMAGFLDCTAAAYCTGARLSWHQGQPQQARRLLEQLDALACEHDWDRLRSRVLLERTRLNLLDGKSREALACGHGLVRLAEAHAKDPNPDIRCYAMLAALWLALHGYRESPSLVEDAYVLLGLLEASEMRLAHAELALALGLVLAELGEANGASLLSSTLDGIERSGAVALVIDCPLKDTALAALQVLDPQLEARLVNLRGNARAPGRPLDDQAIALAGLTVKERQVMGLVADGKSNKQIARELQVTPETIKSHMKSIFAKLKVDNRAQAAVMLRNHG